MADIVTIGPQVNSQPLNDNFAALNDGKMDKGSIFNNVKDYGATGGGVTDDTTAFLEALAIAGNGVVAVPPGTYLLSASLILHAKRLQGIGNPTLKFNVSSGDDGIIMEFSDRSTQETSIDGFIIDMNHTGRHGIWLNGGDYPSISNCRVINSLWDGVHLEPKNSFSWIENYTLDRVQVFDAGGDGFGIVISDETLSSVFINNGVMNNCEVRGVGTGKYSIYLKSNSNNNAAISSLVVIGGEFDARLNGANDGVYATIPAGNGVIESITFIGATIENTLASKSGYCLAGVACYTAIAVVPYNYASGIVEVKQGNLCLASQGYEFMSMRGTKSNFIAYQFIGAASGQIATDSSHRQAEFGSALTLTSVPTFQTGKIAGQEFTLIGAGFPVTIQTDGTLVGSKLKLLSTTITISGGQSVTFRWDGTYWRQVTPVSA